MIAPCPICGNPRLTVSRRGVVGNRKCSILAALIILSSFYAAAAEKKYVVTAPDSSAPCNADYAFGGYYVTRVPPNQALEVLDAKKTETKIPTTYFRVRYCGIEGWISEHFTTGKILDSPPAGAATEEKPLTLLFAKRADNIRRSPNGPVLYQTRELECLEYVAKEGRWYKLRLSASTYGFVHDSVVVSEEEGRKMVLAAVASARMKRSMKRRNG